MKRAGVVVTPEAFQATPKNLHLRRIQPLTENQARTFEAYQNGKNLLLHGLAGTGKTFVSLYLALDELLKRNGYKRIVIVRSTVPTRDVGFMPGKLPEKVANYELPYHAICAELFNRGDAYDILKHRMQIEFPTTSFIRGMTMNDSIVIADEINNMTFHELDSVITRIGSNCKLIMCGDFRQSDLTKSAERAGLKSFMEILDAMGSFEYIEFGQDDIVRSEMVKEYIITKDRLQLNGKVFST
jgi:phosphate starvation-inducible protein PhoH